MTVALAVTFKDLVKNRELWADENLIKTANYYVQDVPGRPRAPRSTAAARPSPRSPMKSSRAPSKAGSPRKAGPRAARSSADAGTRALLEAWDRGEFPSSIYVEGPSEPVRAAMLAELRSAWAAAVLDAPIGRVFLASEASVEEVLRLSGRFVVRSRELRRARGRGL